MHGQAVQLFFHENASLEALLDNPEFTEKLVGATKAVGADLACIDFVPVGNDLRKNHALRAFHWLQNG